MPSTRPPPSPEQLNRSANSGFIASRPSCRDEGAHAADSVARQGASPAASRGGACAAQGARVAARRALTSRPLFASRAAAVARAGPGFLAGLQPGDGPPGHLRRGPRDQGTPVPGAPPQRSPPCARRAALAAPLPRLPRALTARSAPRPRRRSCGSWCARRTAAAACGTWTRSPATPKPSTACASRPAATSSPLRCAHAPDQATRRARPASRMPLASPLSLTLLTPVFALLLPAG